jgi:hypothetical protein
MEKLKIEVDTSDIKEATAALNLLAQAAERAEAALVKLGVRGHSFSIDTSIIPSGTVTMLGNAAAK